MIDPVRLAEQRRAFDPEPLHYRKPKTGEHFDMRTGIVCLRCQGKHLSRRNRIGLCHACWGEVGKKKRAAYQEQHRQRVERWL